MRPLVDRSFSQAISFDDFKFHGETVSEKKKTTKFIDLLHFRLGICCSSILNHNLVQQTRLQAAPWKFGFHREAFISIIVLLISTLCSYLAVKVQVKVLIQKDRFHFLYRKQSQLWILLITDYTFKQTFFIATWGSSPEIKYVKLLFPRIQRKTYLAFLVS